MMFRGYYEKGQEGKNGESYIDFDLKDVPVYISEGRIALTQIQDSLILRENLVAVRDETTGLCEGDIVRSNDSSKRLLGYLKYNEKFKVQTENDEEVDFEHGDGLEVLPGNRDTILKVNDGGIRQTLFESNSVMFRVRDIMYGDSDSITVVLRASRKPILVDIEKTNVAHSERFLKYKNEMMKGRK